MSNVKFYYRAKVNPRETRDGTLEAADRQHALHKIRQLGMIPLEIREDEGLSQDIVKPSGLPKILFANIRFKDVVGFFRHLHDLIDAEIPILRSLQIIKEQTRHPKFLAVLEEVQLSVSDGSGLARALQLRKDVFPGYAISMIHAGEVSGQLKQVLERLCYLMEQQEEINAKVAVSLVYPSIILAVGFVTILVILTFAVPKLSVMFADLDVELPLVTKILLGVSGFLSRFWLLPVAGLIGMGIFIQQLRSQSHGQWLLDRWILRIPFIKDVVRIYDLQRVARTVGIMLKSGVDVPTALECAVGVAQNQVVKGELKKIVQNVIQGSGVSTAFRQSGFFPDDIVSIIHVGEESGRIENGFVKWADAYERLSERIMKTATQLLEPILILILGAVLGFMVMAILLPIFKINLVIS